MSKNSGVRRKTPDILVAERVPSALYSNPATCQLTEKGLQIGFLTYRNAGGPLALRSVYYPLTF